MKWFNIKKQKPKLGQKVLVFEQGYDVTKTTYWHGYAVAVYAKLPRDKRKHVFINQLETRSRTPWVYNYVTHWMPLPKAPEKISIEKDKSRGSWLGAIFS